MGYPELLSFAQTFDAKLITLGDNFRSLRTIVEHAAKLISNNDGHRIEKVFESRRGSGGDIRAERLLTPVAMCDFATNFIKAFTSENNSTKGRWTHQVPTGEFRALARNNRLLDDMEAVLNIAGIKTVRLGRSVLQRDGAQYVYDILGGIYAADIKGLSLMLQIMGVNTSTANRVCQLINGNEVDFVEGRMTNFAQFGMNEVEVKNCTAWFKTQRRSCCKGEHSAVISEVCYEVLKLYVSTGGYDRKATDNTKSINVVQKCLVIMKQNVLARVAILSNADMVDGPLNAVNLMTFHGSKGLEFRQVIFVGVDDKSTPGKGELMSERRLFFVAVIRAKDTLLALHSSTPSRYLAEMGL